MTGCGRRLPFLSASGSDSSATLRHHSYQDGRPAGGPKTTCRSRHLAHQRRLVGKPEGDGTVRAEEWFAARSFASGLWHATVHLGPEPGLSGSQTAGPVSSSSWLRASRCR